MINFNGLIHIILENFIFNGYPNWTQSSTGLNFSFLTLISLETGVLLSRFLLLFFWNGSLQAPHKELKPKYISIPSQPDSSVSPPWPRESKSQATSRTKPRPQSTSVAQTPTPSQPGERNPNLRRPSDEDQPQYSTENTQAFNSSPHLLSSLLRVISCECSLGSRFLRALTLPRQPSSRNRV
jgi:hypothetical protein